MVKKIFFRDPTVSEIKIGKHRVEREVKLENLIDTSESLKEDEYLPIIIEKHEDELIPQTALNGIRYVGEREGNYYQKLWQRFLKRGHSVELNNNDVTINELIKKREPPYKIRGRLFDNVESNSYGIARYGWWDPRTQIHNSTNLYSCVKGSRLFAYSQIYGAKRESERIEISYEYDLRTLKGDMGADIIMRVPSEEIGKSPHFITLRSKPVNLSRERFALAWSFNAEHSCEFKASRITKRYRGRESFICWHIIAADLAFDNDFYHRFKNRSKKEREVPLEMCLFAIPTEFTVVHLNKFKSHFVFEYKDRGDRKVTTVPNIAHKELYLWLLVKKYGTDKTFFTRKKLRDYDWHSTRLDEFLKS